MVIDLMRGTIELVDLPVCIVDPSNASEAVSTGGPSVRLLEPSWWEVNPRNTSVLGSECVLVDVNRQDEGKSAHLCLWFNVDLPASSFSSSSLVTPATPPPPPLSLSLSLSLSFSHSLFWRCLLANNELFLVLTHQKRTSRASGNVSGIVDSSLFSQSSGERPHFFPKYYLSCSTSDPGTADMQDRSAVAVSDRYPGSKNCLRIVAHHRSNWNFPRSLFLPQGCLGPTFSHFSPEIGSARTPGSFSSERKPTFPWSILTNEAPIESSGIHWFSFAVHWFPRRLIKTPMRKAAQAITWTKVDCAMLIYRFVRVAYRLRHGGHFLSDVTMPSLWQWVTQHSCTVILEILVS